MFDAWNAVDFSPSDTLSGIGDSLMPAAEGLVVHPCFRIYLFEIIG